MKTRTADPLFEIGDASSCWLWRGTTNSETGYGQLVLRRSVYENAHRLVYRLLVGPIPAGKQLDHLCRNRRCVNPAHLEVVTNRENSLRRPDVITSRSRTRCSRGHRLTADAIYVRPNGRVECRVCKRASVRKSREAGKQ